MKSDVLSNRRWEQREVVKSRVHILATGHDCRASWNVSSETAQALTEASRAGLIVVRSTRVVSGDVGRNIEMDDDGLGLVAADQLNPQKIRVPFQLCLAKGWTAASYRRRFSAIEVVIAKKEVPHA